MGARLDEVTWRQRVEVLRGFDTAASRENALVRVQFRILHAAGVVKLHLRPDPDQGLEFLDGPLYTKTEEDRRLAEWIRNVAMREGIWGQCGFWRPHTETGWTEAGSVWGLVGLKDAEDNSLTLTVMQETLEAFWLHSAEVK